MPHPKFAQYISAGHDSNGNARRGWIISDPFGWVDFIDEGCRGHASFTRSDHAQAYQMARVEVTPGEYRSQVRASERKAKGLKPWE